MQRRQTKRSTIIGGRHRAKAYRSGYRVARRLGWNRPRGRGATLLALVREIQRVVENDADVVRLIRWMVNSGLVLRTGHLAVQRF